MVEIEDVINYALSLDGAVHEHKSAWDADLIRVCDKMFLLMGIMENGEVTISLKCDPDWALELREMYEHIIPGYHLNKRHWNTINISRIESSTTFINEMVKHSYDMVIAKLPLSKRASLSTF